MRISAAAPLAVLLACAALLAAGCGGGSGSSGELDRNRRRRKARARRPRPGRRRAAPKKATAPNAPAGSKVVACKVAGGGTAGLRATAIDCGTARATMRRWEGDRSCAMAEVPRAAPARSAASAVRRCDRTWHRGQLRPSRRRHRLHRRGERYSQKAGAGTLIASTLRDPRFDHDGHAGMFGARDPEEARGERVGRPRRFVGGGRVGRPRLRRRRPDRDVLRRLGLAARDRELGEARLPRPEQRPALERGPQRRDPLPRFELAALPQPADQVLLLQRLRRGAEAQRADSLRGDQRRRRGGGGGRGAEGDAGRGDREGL